MGSSPSPPSPQQITQDAVQATQAQLPISSAGQESSVFNQTNPYGNLNFGQIGTTAEGTPIWNASTNFSPAQQGLYDLYTGTQYLAGGNAPGALSFGNYGSQSPTQQIGDMTTGRTNQLMGSWLQSVQPFFNTQYDQLYNQMINQGFTPNSPSGSGINDPSANGNPAYNNAMRQLQTNQANAVLGQAATFEPQAFSQASQLYQLPLSVGEQLAQWGAPVSPTTQYTTNTPAFQTPQVSQALGPMEQAAMAQYQAQQAQSNAMMGGLFGIGSSLIGALPF